MRTGSALLALLLLTASLALVPFGTAPAAGNAGCKPSEVLENDQVAIWFQGKKEFVKVEDKADNGSYFYKSGDIAELSDGAPVRVMNLEQAFPQSSSCEVASDDSFVNITIHVVGTVRDAAGGPVGEASVTFVNHFNRSSLGSKFDLRVDSWPWAANSAGHVLAYDLQLTAGDLTLQPADNGVGIVNGAGDQVGYVEWAPNATAAYTDGTQQEANVTSSSTGSEHELAVQLRFDNVRAGYTGLEMDPWFGVGNYLIVAGHLVGLADLEAAAPAVRGPLAQALRA